MIRMGRSSKEKDTSKDTSALQDQNNTTAFQYDQAPPQEATHAVSESESMARDIKDGKLSGFVGAGTVLTGETNFQNMLRVDGHLTGKVASSEGTLIIGSTGQVDADIHVASAIVNGTVNGDITASEKLELGRTAKLVGNVSAPRLVIADGALLEGSCSMVKSSENRDARIEEQRQQFATNELSPVADNSTAESSTDNDTETELSSDSDDEEEKVDAATS